MKRFQTNNDFTRLGSSSNHSEYDGSVNDDAMIKTKNVVVIYQNTASTTTEGDGNGTGTVKDFIKRGQSYFKQNLGQKGTQYSVVKSPFSIAGDEEEDDDDDDHDDGGVKINEYYNSKTSIIGKNGDDLDDEYDGEYSQEADGKDVGSDDENNDEYDDDVSDELEAKL